MTYRETLEYLYSRLPLFTRVGKAAYKADLSNTLSLCSALGNPEKSFKTVHVAGTNGKGSSSHFLASVLQEAGYKTGLFTSPHLKDFRERIRVNGQMIQKRRVSSFVERHQDLFEQIKPSFFEMNVALAFDYFREEQVDIAVIETGLGGRLDSTNVLVPEVSLITNISFDHTDLLGDTLEKIAYEKAGIIKPGIPVVITEKQIEVAGVFMQQAASCNSKIFFAGDYCQVIASEKTDSLLSVEAKTSLPSGKKKNYQLQSPLTGLYQLKNLAGVLVTVEVLSSLQWNISRKHIEEGVRKVLANTGLRGRWERIGTKPDTICDTGHNKAGVQEVLELIARLQHHQLHIVWGMVADKDIDGILTMLPTDAKYYFCKASIPRAMDAIALREHANNYGLQGKAYKSVRGAYAAARKASRTDDFIFIGGSTFVVAEVI